ncbi:MULTISPECIES: citrate/2-methylcitrate synthase [Gordonia]|jgi:citrate synthase|nr:MULTISPECIES: citrate/2-methylcitrate synthase [Gordonia]
MSDVKTMSDVLIAPPGLSGVVVADTEIGDVRGDEGFYHYRQYPAIELARSRTFEEVWHLFAHGYLPDEQASAAFARRVRTLRPIPDEVGGIVASAALLGAPRTELAALRTALSAVGVATGARPLWDATAEQGLADALRVAAVTPTLLAAMYRLRNGDDPVAPREDLPVAANWLYMLTGHEPTPHHARAVEQYLIATIDHGFNASTFTARVVASTGADVYSAICGGVGAFSGPLHGGAPDRALDSLDEIDADGDAAGWARRQLEQRRRIMGFGHAVYRTVDPRSELLRGIAVDLGGPLVERALTAERAVTDVLAQAHPDRPRYANVEFYAGVVMESCGIPRSMFTPTFAVSRVVGWCANILEQSRSRKIIRPSARYVGTPPVR